MPARRPLLRRRPLLAAACAAALAASLLPAARAQTAAVGQPAPAFQLVDTGGRTVKLADFRGRYVVLEWTNPGCPFVAKHYGSRNMQALQKESAAKNVVWLGISSTAPDHRDYLAPAQLAARYQEWGSAASALLMDDDGKVGRAYGARTTPHMYVIDPQGVLVFAGGIDDKRSSNPEDVKTARNFVRAALADAMAGRPVANPTATPYGCSVKYAAG
jgi:peroxiredoxin